MICLIYDGYGASTTTLVFITCVWVPFVQLKNTLFKIISVLMTMLCLSQHRHHDHGIARDHNACGKMFPNVYHLNAGADLAWFHGFPGTHSIRKKWKKLVYTLYDLGKNNEN
ncbi:hypothetical protein Hanom_Chr05g00433481 [Helianthus anomalus]